MRRFLLVLAACQGNSTSPFPAGLEPFEDDPVPMAAPDEVLVTQTTDADFVHIYGRATILVDPESVFTKAMSPQVIAARCSTTSQTFMERNEPEYAYSVLIHYVEDNIVTVEWDDQWRFGDVADFHMMKHQKVDGSTFITRSEGTIELRGTPDGANTDFQIVEHLDAIGASTDDVLTGVKHTYADILAAAHDQPAPSCN